MTALLLLLLSGFGLVHSAKIFIYSPSYSASHIISNGRIADTLVDDGHRVIVVIPEITKSLSNFTGGIKKAAILRIPGVGGAYEAINFESSLMENEFSPFDFRMRWEAAAAVVCEEVLQRTEVLEKLKAERFDAMFTEQIEFCGIGLSEVLGIRTLLWISSTPLMDANSYNLGIPQPLSYVPVIEENDHGDSMTLLQRLDNHINWLKFLFIHHYGTNLMTKTFRTHVRPDFPCVRELARNASLVFVNTDAIFDLPRPISQKVKYIGGLGVKDTRPLQEPFSSMMQKGKKGVVFFSLGSLVLFDTIPIDIRRALIQEFSSLSDFHFLIKTSSSDTSTAELIKHTSNIEMVQWVPQIDLLGHPRLRLFITHGGINGLIESVYRGVPLVLVPVFADQFRNGRNAEKRGIGRVVSKMHFGRLGEVVREVLSDERYLLAAKKLSEQVRSHPERPEDVLKQWTAYAIQFGPLHDLTLEGSRLSSVQYFNLDVLALLAVPPVLFLFTIYLLFRAVCSARNAKTKTE